MNMDGAHRLAAMSFVSGIELSRRFYAEVVRPLLGVEHSAALVGPGSEVLGYDTARSSDHDWGPRVLVFTAPSDVDSQRDGLAGRLPEAFLGYRTIGVTVADAGSWFRGRLGFDPAGGVTVLDWLATPTQLLAEATAGAVYHDGLGALIARRDRLSWYPDDVWRYVLASQWKRIGEEEHLMGRAGEAGDDLGSAVLAARLVRDVMRLCLLLARRWPPYPKWLGTAFSRLPEAAEIGPALAAALAATDWRGREAGLCAAYRAAAGWTNRLGLAEAVDPAPRPFWDRPFQVLDAQRFTAALLAAVTDPAVRALPPVGAVDQFVDSTDVLSHTDRARTAALALLSSR
jgi:hypothetical protein